MLARPMDLHVERARVGGAEGLRSQEPPRSEHDACVWYVCKLCVSRIWYEIIGSSCLRDVKFGTQNVGGRADGCLTMDGWSKLSGIVPCSLPGAVSAIRCSGPRRS